MKFTKLVDLPKTKMEAVIAGGLVSFAIIVVWGLVSLTRNTPSVLPAIDDTDLPGHRSRMVLFTDFGTGCQYLATHNAGALTPRLDESGKPLCRVFRP